MWQWTEQKSTLEKKKTGGGTTTETTYAYSQAWVDHKVDSSQFYHGLGHENPAGGMLLFPAQVFVTPRATMGAFTVTGELLDDMDWYVSLSPGNYSTDYLSHKIVGNHSVSVYQGGGYYFGPDPTDPHIGDTRVTFSYVPQQVVSVIAAQFGTALTSYVTSNKRTVLLVEQGNVSMDAMFLHASKKISTMTWVWRGVGFLLLWFGLAAMVAPIAVLGDVLPLIGNILEAGSDIVTFLLALIIASIVIALSWLAFRPLVSLGIVLVVGGLSVGVWKCRRDQKKQQAEVYVPGAEPTEKTSLV